MEPAGNPAVLDESKLSLHFLIGDSILDNYRKGLRVPTAGKNVHFKGRTADGLGAYSVKHVTKRLAGE